MSSDEVKKVMVRGEQTVVLVEQLGPNPWNPNRQTDFIFEKEKASIEEFGFIDPILVRVKDGNYQIIDGEHRWKAAKEMGLRDVSIISLGEIPDHVAKKLTIIMNETRGRADDTLMSKLVLELKSEVGMEDLTRLLPYTEMELETMVAKAEVNWDEVKPGLSGGTPKAPTDKEVLTFKVNESTAAAFKGALRKVNELLHPEEDADQVNPEEALAVISQIINQTDVGAYLAEDPAQDETTS